MIVTAVVGVLSAIAIPAYLSHQARTKTAEARVNLRSLWSLQRGYFLEFDAYSSIIQRVGFAPERGNRYAYYAGGSGELVTRATGESDRRCTTCIGIGVDRWKHASVPADPLPPAGASWGAVGREWVGGAIGNVDSDPTLDAWEISAVTRPTDKHVAGEAIHIIDDGN